MSFFNLWSSRANARTSSPLPDADDTADLLAQLRVLEREADRDEDGSFSLVGEASADGARPREVGAGVRSAHSGPTYRSLGAAAGSGAGGEYDFTTPLRHGAGRMIQSGGELGRVPFLKTSPMSVKDRSRLSPGPSSVSGSSKLLEHVFVDAEFVSNTCCGYIGETAYFCLRNKMPGYVSCQTTSHAERRFSPAVDCFYGPIGPYYNTPAANSERSVNINDLTGAQQERFMGARYSRAGWERIFDDVLSAGRGTRSASGVRGPPAVVTMPAREEDHGDRGEQGSLPYLSTSGSVDSKTLMNEEEPGMLERGVMEEMEVDQVGVHSALQQLREDTARGFKVLQDNMRQVIAEETGDLPYLLERHGSIANFLEVTAAEPLRLMENRLHNSMDDLERRVAQNQASTGLIKLFRRLVDQVDRRHLDSDSRLRALEQHVNREAGPLPSRLVVDSGEEMVDIAGYQVPASMVFWIQKIREMENRVEVLNARAKNGGVTIGDRSFSSEMELQSFWMKHDLAGVGMAALVDIVSLIQAFGSSETISAQDFLTTSEKAKKVNLRPGEGGFAASFKTRHLDVSRARRRVLVLQAP